MQIEQWNQQTALAFHGMNKQQIYHIYRRLTNGKYACIGAIKWNCNYNAIPIKQKYWKLIYFADRS